MEEKRPKTKASDLTGKKDDDDDAQKKEGKPFDALVKTGDLVIVARPTRLRRSNSTGTGPEDFGGKGKWPGHRNRFSPAYDAYCPMSMFLYVESKETNKDWIGGNKDWIKANMANPPLWWVNLLDCNGKVVGCWNYCPHFSVNVVDYKNLFNESQKEKGFQCPLTPVFDKAKAKFSETDCLKQSTTKFFLLLN